MLPVTPTTINLPESESLIVPEMLKSINVNFILQPDLEKAFPGSAVGQK
jgi:hypothetical protein